MSLPSSSTAPTSFRRRAIIGSTDIDTMVPNVAVVPLSSQTLRMPFLSEDVSFLAPEGFAAVEWATHEDCIRFHGTFPLDVTMLCATAQPIAPGHGLLNSSDAALGTFRLVEAKFAKAVALAKDEWFEDGIESAFYRALSTLVHTYGDAAVAAVETFLESPSKNIEVAVEATQRLGEIDHPASYRYRRTLLEKLVLSASARVRHAAAAGLAAMDDPSSLSALIDARDRESNRRLRHFLQLVVDQLERTKACRSS